MEKTLKFGIRHSLFAVLAFVSAVGTGRLAGGDNKDAEAKNEDKRFPVVVVSILATSRNKVVDPRLQCLADGVQKTEPKLTGFKVENISRQKLGFGQKYEFELIADQTLPVTLEKGMGKEKPLHMRVHPPGMGKIVYEIGCGKYVTVITPFKTKDEDRLIIAIRIQCEK
jgi:hypothetical protein